MNHNDGKHGTNLAHEGINTGRMMISLNQSNSSFGANNTLSRKFSLAMDRYAEAHVTRRGPGDARPTARQVVLDEFKGREVPLKDLVIVITGANSGLGFQTAKALAVTGARLFLTARNVAAGEDAARLIAADTGKGINAIEVVQLDLDSLESVRQAATAIASKTDKVNILINNAGECSCPY